MAKRIYLGREISKYAKIAGGAIITVTSLFFVLMVLGFTITGSDDYCLGTLDDPCVSYGKICNTGPNNYDIYNPEGLKLDFSPTIENYWIFFKDGRVKKEFLYNLGVNHSTAGWRYENFTNATKSRKDRVYVHRFARYSCQDYMLVGLKTESKDLIKWGMGVGKEYLDPFWYGVNDTATNLVSGSISVELGTPINFTTNLTGAATTCVDIDHPEYGDNYTCGNPANFNFNISYFRETEFNDSSTSKNISWFGGLCYQETANVATDCGGLDTGAYLISGAWTSAENIYDGSWGTSGHAQSSSTSFVFFNYTKPYGALNSSLWQVKDYIGTDNLTIEQQCFNQNPLQFRINSSYLGYTKWDCWNGTDYILLRDAIGVNAEYVYEEAMIWDLGSYYKTEYIKGHQYDEIENVSVNVSGYVSNGDYPTNVKIYINNTLSNNLGLVFDGEITLDELNEGSTTKNITFSQAETNNKY